MQKRSCPETIVAVDRFTITAMESFKFFEGKMRKDEHKYNDETEPFKSLSFFVFQIDCAIAINEP